MRRWVRPSRKERQFTVVINRVIMTGEPEKGRVGTGPAPTRPVAAVSIFAIFDVPVIVGAVNWWLARHTTAASNAPVAGGVDDSAGRRYRHRAGLDSFAPGAAPARAGCRPPDRTGELTMKKIIQVRIFKGGKQYVAECLDLPVVTQGKTLDELTENLREAIGLHLRSENLADLDLADEPSVLASFELEPLLHAKA